MFSWSPKYCGHLPLSSFLISILSFFPLVTIPGSITAFIYRHIPSSSFTYLDVFGILSTAACLCTGTDQANSPLHLLLSPWGHCWTSQWNYHGRTTGQGMEGAGFSQSLLWQNCNWILTNTFHALQGSVWQMPPEKCSISLPVFSALLDECKCHGHLEQKRAKMLYCPKSGRQHPFLVFSWQSWLGAFLGYECQCTPGTLVVGGSHFVEDNLHFPGEGGKVFAGEEDRAGMWNTYEFPADE